MRLAQHRLACKFHHHLHHPSPPTSTHRPSLPNTFTTQDRNRPNSENDDDGDDDDDAS
jgi:hypothetical protein